MPQHSSFPVIVSVTNRNYTLHRRTFAAIRGAGFGRIYATVEPGVALGWLNGELTVHKERRGQWRNFVEALRIGIATEAEHFITLEDDVELCRGTSEFLHRANWPELKCGCLQLYSANPLSGYPRGRRFRLDVTHALDLVGACALMFRRDAAINLVKWADTQGWRGDSPGSIDEPEKKKAADTFVGEVLTRLDYSIWSHNPTLANHIGEESTLGHAKESPTRIPLDFPGLDADLTMIFADEIAMVESKVCPEAIDSDAQLGMQAKADSKRTGSIISCGDPCVS